MDKFQNQYRIPSTRLQNWDYGCDGAYFVTICTMDRDCFLGDITNGEMNLSNVGIIADILWHEIKNHANNIDLGEFIVMPNHIHGILILKGNEVANTTTHANETMHANETTHTNQTTHALSLPPTIGQHRFQNQGKNTLSSIVGSFKSAVSKHAHCLGFHCEWQPRFYEHIITNDSDYQRIKDYIASNPSKWIDDKFHPSKP
jgi:putative transposase